MLHARAAASRRTFLKHIGAGALMPLALPRLVRAASANGKVQHAGIGVNGMGFNDLHSIASHEHVDVAAICDVDKNRIKRAAEQWPNAKHFDDYRRMFDEFGDQIDSVNVSTPDHTHAAITLTAMSRGKHVYTEKPLTHDLWEARQLTLAAERSPDLVTQMGNQINSRTVYRTAVQMIQEGTIGKVREVHSFVTSGIEIDERPAEGDTIPDSLNWEAWIGPASMRPYVKDIYHPYRWRYWLDFGTGQMGNFGAHLFDPVTNALQLGPARTAVSEGNGATEEHWPRGGQIRFTFDATEYTDDAGLTVTWYDGGRRPPEDLVDMPEGRSLPSNGSIFIGEKGVMMLPHVGAPQFLPEELNRSITRPTLEPRNHWHSFIDAVRGEDETTSRFGISGPLTELCLVGTVAQQHHGELLKWDPQAMRFIDNPQATELVKPAYRSGWFPG